MVQWITVLTIFRMPMKVKIGCLEVWKTVDNLQLDWERVSCFIADNTNCNFWIKYSLYTNIFTLNERVIKPNCNAHIVHNEIRCLLENLNVNVKYCMEDILAFFNIGKKNWHLKNFIFL